MAASFDAALEPFDATVTTVTVVEEDCVEDVVEKLDDDPELDTTGPERKLVNAVRNVLFKESKLHNGMLIGGNLAVN